MKYIIILICIITNQTVFAQHPSNDSCINSNPDILIVSKENNKINTDKSISTVQTSNCSIVFQNTTYKTSFKKDADEICLTNKKISILFFGLKNGINIINGAVNNCLITIYKPNNEVEHTCKVSGKVMYDGITISSDELNIDLIKSKYAFKLSNINVSSTCAN